MIRKKKKVKNALFALTILTFKSLICNLTDFPTKKTINIILNRICVKKLIKTGLTKTAMKKLLLDSFTPWLV